jgi:hypothetical protein
VALSERPLKSEILLVKILKGFLPLIAAFSVFGTAQTASANDVNLWNLNWHLAVNNGLLFPGNGISIAASNGTNAQYWWYNKNVFYSSIGGNNTFCLDVQDNGLSVDSKPVVVNQCNGTPSQTWFYDRASGQITSALSTPQASWCLGAYENQLFEGNRVDISHCNGSIGQRWAVN